MSITPATDADPSTDGHQVTLSPGQTIFAVTVTAEDGVTTTTYTVTVNPDDIAPSLSSATVDGDQMVLTFGETLFAPRLPAPRDFVVTVTAGQGPTAVTSNVAVNSLTMSDTQVMLTLAVATVSGDIVSVTYTKGTNPITDTADNEITGFTETVTNLLTPVVDETAPSLSSATVDGNELVLSFDETLGTSSQPAAADFSVTTTLGATASSVGVDSATMSGTDVTLTLSESVRASDTVAVTYTPGADPIRDTARNEVAGFTETLTNITAAAADAALSALSLTGVALSPAFASGTTTYTASVASTVTSTTVTATATDTRAQVSVTPATDADPNTGGHQVTLWPGATIITVTVTAEDAATTATYSVTVDRDATAPSLSSATVDGDELVLSFDETLDASSQPAAADFSVTTTLGTTTSSVGVDSATVSGTDVTLTLSTPVRASDTVAVAYTPGANPIRDIALNEVGHGTGRVTNNTAAATDATLSALSLSGVTLSPAFAPGATTYTASVTSTVVSTTLTFTATDTRAQVSVIPATDDDPNTDGHQLTLLSGQNIITVTVTAEDAATAATYSVTVDRDDTSPSLSSATVDGDEIVLSFDETLDNSVPATADFYVTKTLGTTTFSVGVDLVTVSGTDVTVTLASAVRASDTVAVTYTPGAVPIRDTADNEVAGFTEESVTNITAASADATLSALSLTDVTLSPAFASGTTTYTADVASTVTSTTLTFTVAEARAQVSVTPATDDDPNTDGHQVTLSSGLNTITVTVTAEDAVTTAAYSVTVDRDITAPSLSSATVDGTELVLSFDETLDASSQPAETDFSVTKTLGTTDSSVGVDSVTVSGTDVTLTLAAATGSGDIVSVTYTKGTDPIRDTADNEVAGFTETATNLLTPSLSSATVDGNELVLTFEPALEPAPAVGDFSVSVTDSATSQASTPTVSSVTMSAGVVTLTLASPVRASDTVAVTYTDEVASFSDKPVTNNTAAATDAALSALSLTGVTLSPAFAAGTTTYTADVASTVTSTTLTATTADTRAQVSVTPATDDDPNTDGHQVTLSPGPNTITVTVTAEDGVTTDTYSVTVDRDATAPPLSSATVDGDELVLSFDETLDASSQPAETDFSVTTTLGTTTSSVGVDSVTVSGTDVTLTLSSAVRASDTVAVTYTAGAVPIRDTAHNEVAGFTETVTNNTAAATDAALSALSLTSVTLSPTFAAGTTTYTADVVRTVTSTTLTFTTADTRAQASITPATDADPNTDGHQVTLSPGPNTITVTVTAEDGVTTATYTVTVDRDATAPSLSSATVNGTQLVLSFDETLDTSLSPAPSDFSVTVTAGQGPTEVASSVTVNLVTVSGTNVTLTLAAATVSGDIVSVTYTKGTNAIRDNADNEVAGFTETVTNLLTPSLSSATVDGNEIVLTFEPALGSAPAVGDFSVSVTDSATNQASTPTVSTVTMSAGVVTLTLASPVRASDTVAATYTDDDAGFTDKPVTNNTAAATDATLTALSLTSVTLSPAFAAGTTTYTADVASTVTSTTLTFTTADTRAQVSVTPATDADANTEGHQVALSPGPNTITVTVTAEDAVTTDTYTVTVDRAANPPLSSATVDGNEIVLTFDAALGSAPAVGDFSVSVTDSTTNQASTPTVSSVTMTAAVVTLTLAEAVRASDTVVVTFTDDDAGFTDKPVTNNTAVATDATLTALSLTSVTLSPAFAAGTTTYTADVASTVTSTTLTFTTADTRAQVSVTPATDADPNTEGHQITLSPGPNTITVTVTAENGSTNATYIVGITRAS